MEVSEIIRQRRTELGLSQAELAARVGVDKRQIRRYEAGGTQPTLPVALAVAHALGMSIDELAGQPTRRTVLIVPKKPAYISIAETLKAEVLAGSYDDEPLPGNATIAERFDVNMKTAGRAIQQLAAEGIVVTRPGMRAISAPSESRAARPHTGHNGDTLDSAAPNLSDLWMEVHRVAALQRAQSDELRHLTAIVTAIAERLNVPVPIRHASTEPEG